ncbi:TetR/AcrR family transcriptional regulator [Nonomuraea rubra]|uniref:TetR/AcrR family transcriptional regulator n=1 Tax=Nonomuraea rubra TaxID=46180 RepID=UPI0036124510
MARLTRAETQERNRAKVLAAARAEFAERGYREAKIDDIADRAELTRGAVYSNFPGKRALYFAVLADLAERVPVTALEEPALTVREALAEVARAWVTRLPLATEDERQPSRLSMHLIPEILADEVTRRPYAQLMQLNAVLLGLAMERLRPPKEPDGRLVRLAESVLTVLQGAAQLSAAAPGFVEPFNVIRVCEQLAALDLGDRWAPAPLLPGCGRPPSPGRRRPGRPTRSVAGRRGWSATASWRCSGCTGSRPQRTRSARPRRAPRSPRSWRPVRPRSCCRWPGW